jgi:hypothetical protein
LFLRIVIHVAQAHGVYPGGGDARSDGLLLARIAARLFEFQRDTLSHISVECDSRQVIRIQMEPRFDVPARQMRAIKNRFLVGSHHNLCKAVFGELAAGKKLPDREPGLELWFQLGSNEGPLNRRYFGISGADSTVLRSVNSRMLYR